MSEQKTIFALYHVYDRVVEGVADRQCKRIGFFESRKQCVDLIDEYKGYPGFKEHPETCFKILEYEIGQEYWREEFLS